MNDMMKKKYMIKARFVSLLLIAVLCLTTVQAAAATRFSDGVYTFEKTEDNNAVVVDCNLTDAEINVPDSVLGYPVVGIGDYAFLNYSTVRRVSLPDSLSTIGKYAFASDPDLEAVTIPRSCTAIADNAFWNSTNVTILCYPDSYALTYAQEHEMAYTLLDTKTDIADAQVSLEADVFRYDGESHEPAVTVTLGDDILTPETDYTVAYADNQNVGTATVTVTGCGDYEGEQPATFAIKNVLGDTDGDGLVGIIDVTLIQRRLAGLEVPDPDRVDLVGNVSGSGTLEIVDATLIQRWLAGLSTDPYPIDSLMD